MDDELKKLGQDFLGLLLKSGASGHFLCTQVLVEVEKDREALHIGVHQTSLAVVYTLWLIKVPYITDTPPHCRLYRHLDR